MISAIPSRTKLSVAITATVFSTLLHAQESAFSSAFSFGDSLTDVGNLGAAFTDSGRGEDIAINQFASRLGMEVMTPSIQLGNGWAVGGARAADVLTSIVGQARYAELFPGVDSSYNSPYSALFPNSIPNPDGQSFLDVNDGAIDSRAVYYLDGGGNDIIYAIQEGEAVSDGLQRVESVSAMMVASVQALVDAGAKTVLLANMPLVGSTPLLKSFGDQAAEYADLLSTTFNENIKDGVQGIAGVLVVDMQGVFELALSKPELFGFAALDHTQTCYQQGSAPANCNTSQYGLGMSEENANLLFFNDGLHPTVAGQGLIADYYASVVRAAASAAVLPEMGLSQSRKYTDLLTDSLLSERYTTANRRMFSIGAYGDVDYEQNLSSSGDSQEASVIIGMTFPLQDNLEVGIAVSLDDADYSDAITNVDANAFHLSAFGRFHHQRLFVEASASYSLIDYDDISRSITLANYSNKVSGSTDGNATNFNVKVGARLLSDGFDLGPFLAISYSEAEVDGYKEKSISELTYLNSAGDLRDPLGMNFGHQKRYLTSSRLGLFAQKNWSSTSVYGELWYETHSGTSEDTVTVGINSIAGISADLPGYDSHDKGLFEDGVAALVGMRFSVNENMYLRTNIKARPNSNTASIDLTFRF